MDKVECSVCGKPRSRKRSRGIYVEVAGVQYVCFSCRKLPFDEVMDALRIGAVYVARARASDSNQYRALVSFKR